MNHRKDKKKIDSVWFLVGLSVMSAALILVRNATYGPELFWDSVAYIHVARSLLAGEGFVDFNGTIYAYWPPLYPVLLATASLFVFDPYDVAPYVNAIILGLTVFFIGKWLWIRMESNFLIVWGCLAIALSPPLTWIASMVSSEATFILFVTLALIRADEFLIEDNFSSLFWSAVFTSLACLTRYPGIVLTLTTIILLFLVLLKRNDITALRKLRLIGFYLLISTTPIALWMLRNILLVGHPTGARYPQPTTLMQTADVFLDVLAKWMLPELSRSYTSFASLVLIPCLIILAIVVGHVAIHLYRGDVNSNSRKTLYLFGSFLFIYICSIAVAIMNTEHEISSQRLLSPGYISFVLVILVAINSSWRLRERFMIIVFLSSWILYLAIYNVQAINQANIGYDRGLASPHFVDSNTLQYTGEIVSQDSQIFGNQLDAIYLHTDGSAEYRELSHGLENLRINTKNMPDGAYIVWMHHPWGKERFGYDAADLRILPELKLIKELSDGVIFQIDKSVASNLSLETYLSYYKSVIYDEPVIVSYFEVYFVENKLIYVKESCSRLDTRGNFFLYITPTKSEDIPVKHKDLGFDILDFEFDRFGVRFDGKCLVARDLPSYHFTRIHTGQYAYDEGILWEKATSLDK